MKKLFLILAVAAFMVACTPKTQPVVEPQEEDVVAVVDEVEEVVADQPATTTKPATTKPVATKPTTTTPATTTPAVEETKVAEPVKEEPKPDEPKTNQVKRR